MPECNLQYPIDTVPEMIINAVPMDEEVGQMESLCQPLTEILPIGDSAVVFVAFDQPLCGIFSNAHTFRQPLQPPLPLPMNTDEKEPLPIDESESLNFLWTLERRDKVGTAWHVPTALDLIGAYFLGSDAIDNANRPQGENGRIISQAAHSIARIHQLPNSFALVGRLTIKGGIQAGKNFSAYRNVNHVIPEPLKSLSDKLPNDSKLCPYAPHQRQYQFWPFKSDTK